MLKKIFTPVFTGMLLFGISACAQSKKTKSTTSGSSYANLVEANSQRSLPGMRGAEPSTEYHFVIVWTSKQKPETFFWRGQEGWMPCNVSKVHLIKGKKPGNYSDMEAWYSTEDINLSAVSKGDTLELVPVAGGKYPTPAEVPQTVTNTVFFKTTKTNWLRLPVKNIAVKKAVAMP